MTLWNRDLYLPMDHWAEEFTKNKGAKSVLERNFEVTSIENGFLVRVDGKRHIAATAKDVGELIEKLCGEKKCEKCGK